MNRQTRRNRAIAKVFAVIIIVALIASSAGYLFYAFGADAESEANARSRIEALPGVLELIKAYYKDEKSMAELVDAAYSGIFDSLDQWSEYYSTLEEENAFLDAVDPSYVGIGVTVEDTEGGVLITEVNPFGPAADAGVRTGGLVKTIDGKDVSKLPGTALVKLMRGDAGTKIIIGISYNGIVETYSLVRRRVPDTAVYSRLLDGGIGYIRIIRISELCDAEFTLAHTELINAGAKSLIIDLRGNQGGFMDAAARIAEELMPAGTIASYVRQGQTIETLYAEGSSFKQLPEVVLIDEDTASAAEMLAGALKDSGSAKIIGTVSYGKGVAQGTVELDNGDAMKLSTVYFVTPNGHYIDGNGIRPDEIVYSDYGFTDTQIASLTKDVIPMDEGKKYSAGSSGRNVLAAQQRLRLLGFGVDANSVMDEKTVEAIKYVQHAGGGSPYGGLDFGTIAMIEARYKAFCTPGGVDLQLARAIELLKK